MPLIKPINLSSEGLLLKFIKMFLLLNFQIEKRTNINPTVVLKIVGSVKVNMSNPVGIPMTPKVTNDLSFVKSKVLRSLYMGRAETNKQETMFNEIAADGSRICSQKAFNTIPLPKPVAPWTIPAKNAPKIKID
jgi:hypothetical protein